MSNLQLKVLPFPIKLSAGQFSPLPAIRGETVF